MLRVRYVLRLGWLCALLIGAGCGGVHSSTDARPVDTPSLDATATCDPVAKFGAPMLLMGIAMPGFHEGTARLSADELSIYLTGSLPGADRNLYTTHRNSLVDPFETPIPITAQNSPVQDFDPDVSPDGLALWFGSNRVSNEGLHVYVATRASTLAEFGPPGVAAFINSTDTQQSDAQPFVTADGNELWFVSTRAGGTSGYDIWHAIWLGTKFSTPVAVPELNSSADDYLPTLSADRLTVYFASTRAGNNTKGGFDIWMSHRSDASDGFAVPVLVDELNTAGTDWATWLSADNCRLYGTNDAGIFVATRQP